MEDISGNKRGREGCDESSEETPEAKRLREELLQDILEYDSYPGGEHDLASVIKSLEDEIGLPSPPPAPLVPGVVPQPDLGYLFEASDDELGLPPTVPPSSDVDASSGDAEGGAFGNIWDSADKIPVIYDGLNVSGLDPEDEAGASGGENGVAVEGDWFDYDDEFYAAVDFADLQWQQESLPAV